MILTVVLCAITIGIRIMPGTKSAVKMSARFSPSHIRSSRSTSLKF